jgi:hypothetical protein
MDFNPKQIQSISNVNFLHSLLQNSDQTSCTTDLIDAISDRQMQILDLLIEEKCTIDFSLFKNKETLQFLKELNNDLEKCN